MSRRIDDLERGRETNRENIAALIARMAVVDNQQIGIARSLSEIQTGLKEHIQQTESSKAARGGGP
jgi:hypothetical protein